MPYIFTLYFVILLCKLDYYISKDVRRVKEAINRSFFIIDGIVNSVTEGRFIKVF